MTVIAGATELSTNQPINTFLEYVDAVYIHPNERQLKQLLGRNVTLHRTQNEDIQYFQKRAKVVQEIINNSSYYSTDKYDITKLSINQSGTQPSLKLTANGLDISIKFSVSAKDRMQKIDELTIEGKHTPMSRAPRHKSDPFNTTAIDLAIQYLKTVIITPSKEGFTTLLAYNVKALHIANGKEVADTAGIKEVTSLYNDTMLNTHHPRFDEITFTTTPNSAEVNFSFNDPHTKNVRGKLSLFISQEEGLPKIESIILNTRNV